MNAAPSHALARGPLALICGLTFVVILTIGLLPTLLREGTRDWIAYDQAAARLAAGDPLYVFELPTPDDEYYLYPPAMAALWGAVGSPTALLAAKLVALSAVAVLVLVVAPGSDRRRTLAIGGALGLAGLIAAPNIHDMILGNVMALYIGAVAISLASRGWVGAIPLGLVCALALKPVIGPYLLWLAITRRGDALRVLGVAIAASALTAAIIGPERYVEYLTALPRMSVLAGLPSGNVGLTAISQPLALVGLVAVYVVTIVAATRMGPWQSAAIAVAAGLIAQPTIGFNYAGLLLLAVIVLWRADHVAGLIACVVVPLATVVSPPLAAAAIIALAVLGPRRSVTMIPPDPISPRVPA